MRTLVLQIDGRKLDSYEDYIAIVQKQAQFPTDCRGNIDVYLDWICDLSWLDVDSIHFLFEHWDSFQQRQPRLARRIVDDIQKSIIPFWQEEAPHCIVQGRTKSVTLVILP